MWRSRGTLHAPQRRKVDDTRPIRPLSIWVVDRVRACPAGSQKTVTKSELAQRAIAESTSPAKLDTHLGARAG